MSLPEIAVARPCEHCGVTLAATDIHERRLCRWAAIFTRNVKEGQVRLYGSPRFLDMSVPLRALGAEVLMVPGSDTDWAAPYVSPETLRHFAVENDDRLYQAHELFRSANFLKYTQFYYGVAVRLTLRALHTLVDGVLSGRSMGSLLGGALHRYYTDMAHAGLTYQDPVGVAALFDVDYDVLTSPNVVLARYTHVAERSITTESYESSSIAGDTLVHDWDETHLAYTDNNNGKLSVALVMDRDNLGERLKMQMAMTPGGLW